MICRTWRGWTKPVDADAYEELLRSTIIPGIVARRLQEFQGIELARRTCDNEEEFLTIMWFGSMRAVEAFAGPDATAAVVPPAARALLSRFEERSQHYAVKGEWLANGSTETARAN